MLSRDLQRCVRPSRAAAAHYQSSSHDQPRKYSGRSKLELRALVWNQIESQSDAERVNVHRLSALNRNVPGRIIAENIVACCKDARCEVYFCAICGRNQRGVASTETLRHALRFKNACILTILLVEVSGSKLHMVDLSKVHDKLRKRLKRSDIRSAIGGTEADYKAEKDAWVIHVHLLVFGDIEDSLEKLRAIFKHDDFDRPIVRQPLRDPVCQISYLQKFGTYHRPGKPGAKGRGRAYPMKPDQIAQLARWTEHKRLTDFQFLLGFRRRGGRLIAEPSTKALLDEPGEHAGDVATWRRHFEGGRNASKRGNPRRV